MWISELMVAKYPELASGLRCFCFEGIIVVGLTFLANSLSSLDNSRCRQLSPSTLKHLP
jgi:hypothetical protein